MKARALPYALALGAITLTLGSCYHLDTKMNSKTASAQDDAKNDVQAIDVVSAHHFSKNIADYDWTLQSSTNAQLSNFANNKRATFTIDKGQLNFTVGCNLHFGSVAMAGDVMRVLDGFASTRKACDRQEHLAESALTASFDGATFVINTQQDMVTLTQIHQGGRHVWQGVPKVNAGKPAIIYWQIDPKYALCQDGSKRCLMVRAVQYDDLGIKIGVGAWRDFQGRIDGYEHNPKLDQIVRIKAYTIPQDDDSQGNQIRYVLDRVIESGVAID